MVGKRAYHYTTVALFPILITVHLTLPILMTVHSALHVSHTNNSALDASHTNDSSLHVSHTNDSALVMHCSKCVFVLHLIIASLATFLEVLSFPLAIPLFLLRLKNLFPVFLLLIPCTQKEQAIGILSCLTRTPTRCTFDLITNFIRASYNICPKTTKAAPEVPRGHMATLLLLLLLY